MEWNEPPMIEIGENLKNVIGEIAGVAFMGWCIWFMFNNKD
jgi:hypothetical protein